MLTTLLAAAFGVGLMVAFLLLAERAADHLSRH
jgi:hypothetical protein